jgi:predicted RNA-binding Zn ribbon-like protein
VKAVDSIDYLADSEPAPGRLALVQRFVNTVDHEHGREVLSEPAKLSSLLAELGLLAPGTRATRADLERAHGLRESLRALALANNGVPTDVELQAEVTVVVEEGVGRLEPARRDVGGALAELVGIVYTAMADGTWTRLKACRRDVCGWLFYDHSRNRSAVWCQMAVCGNRTKTKAYRARRAPGTNRSSVIHKPPTASAAPASAMKTPPAPSTVRAKKSRSPGSARTTT